MSSQSAASNPARKSTLTLKTDKAATGTTDADKVNVAVVGATGAVGEAMIEILDQRNFPVNTLYPLASERSAGGTVQLGGKNIRVGLLNEFDFSTVDLALFSAGGSVSQEYAPKAVAAGAIVVDNTSHFRYDDDVPLVIPEVNLHALAQHKGIIANPNCSTIQMLVALKPIHDVATIERINVCTYQSVSGGGRRAIEELAGQTAALLSGQPIVAEALPVQIAFNVLPHIDEFQDNGYTREEMKMVWETRKIFEDDSIMVNPTAVRVPVFYAHSEAIHIETRDALSATRAKELLQQAPGVVVMDDPQSGKYPTAAIDATGKDGVYVGRIRNDISHDKGLNLWVVSDNVRKGAALNSVQIAERLFVGDQAESERYGNRINRIAARL